MRQPLLSVVIKTSLERRRMTEKTREERVLCGIGRGGQHPCPHPAVAVLVGEVPVCEGHEILYEQTGPRADELQLSLAYLARWHRLADYYGVEPLRDALEEIRGGFASELAELQEKERRIKEQYSLPPGALELLRAEERQREPAPESEGRRRWEEADRRASRFNAAIGAIEEGIDTLHLKMEDLVLGLLEEESRKAAEEAGRVKEESGL
jgi:hypothetical protein